LNRSNLDGASTGDNKAIELNPNYAEAYNNRGVTKAGKGDLKGILAEGTGQISFGRLKTQEIQSFCIFD